MVNVNLTTGVIDRIMRTHNTDVDPPSEPILQCTSRKALNANASGEPRFRLELSDGVYKWNVCTTSTQSGHRLANDEMVENDVIRLTKYTTQNQPNNTKIVIVVMDFEKLASMPNVVGSPNIWSQDVEMTPAENAPAKAAVYGAPRPQAQPIRGQNGAGRSTQDNVNPIVGLSPYQNKWKIRARIGQKNDIKNYNNAKGPGKLFSVDLIDSSGEIRATAFNEECDRLFNLLEPGQLYYISGGRIKSANKKFSTIKNDYELTFDKTTDVTPCHDDGGSDIPNFCFNFTKICNMATLADGDVIDVIGVVKSVADVTSINTKDGRQLAQRKVMLVDKDTNSNAPVDVTLTLWADRATEFTGNENAIMALKNVRIHEFMGGKTLSANQATAMHMNPDIPICKEMRLWYDNEGRLLDSATSLSSRGENSGGSNLWIPIESAETAFQPGADDIKEYFTVNAVVTFTKHDTSLYQGCPGDGCKKKVIDNNDGTYRCEKCNKNYNSFKYILMLSASIADFSGQKWVTMFSETAEKFLNISTDKLGELKETDNDAFVKVFEDSTYKPHQFRIAARADNWNDEQRIRWTVMSVSPVNVTEYTKFINEQSNLIEASN